MYLIGYDIGSSSVKTCIVDAQSGQTVGSAFYPKQEAPILSRKAGWAEQNPEDWWSYLKQATAEAMTAAAERTGHTTETLKNALAAIGISYQMHGLVCVDREQRVLRPAIIWCDSRAVPYGKRAFETLGADFCLSHLLNSPGNFTASKLAWVKENEPEVFERIDKILLPGDYIAMRLTGTACTTVSGLSEGMFWDFRTNSVCHELMDCLELDMSLIPDLQPTFGEQGCVTDHVAQELGIKAGIPVTYRAGDQPNNALSLNVFNPGEIASTAGTSGVVYGVNGTTSHDPLSRVNTFAHVNHTAGMNGYRFPADNLIRTGVLLCINGTGILNSWIRRNVATEKCSYEDLNRLAGSVPVGSEGVSIIPFGNGAERVMQNRETGCSIHGLNFNIHRREHLIRAAQEGIVFAFRQGIDIMREMGMNVTRIHAGRANMFLSPIFRDTLAGVTGATIELYETDGAAGAARGAGIGAGIYSDNREAFATLQRLAVIEPDEKLRLHYLAAYEQWTEALHKATQP
ncbi:MAG: FGGY family carbohydrate kinase [Clostridium sp.]|nr:FGGY family carbohydrate kinase [Clostridium sp.]